MRSKVLQIISDNMSDDYKKKMDELNEKLIRTFMIPSNLLSPQRTSNPSTQNSGKDVGRFDSSRGFKNINPKILYHITRSRNVDSILKTGIVAGRRRGMTCNRKNQKSVFLTDDLDYIFTNQLGINWYSDIAVFSVEDTGVVSHTFRCPFSGNEKIYPHEYTIDVVPPSAIISVSFYERLKRGKYQLIKTIDLR